jgi:hypothetical protein
MLLFSCHQFHLRDCVHGRVGGGYRLQQLLVRGGGGGDTELVSQHRRVCPQVFHDALVRVDVRVLGGGKVLEGGKKGDGVLVDQEGAERAEAAGKNRDGGYVNIGIIRASDQVSSLWFTLSNSMFY